MKSSLFVCASDYSSTYVRTDFIYGDDGRITSATVYFCCNDTVAFIMDCLFDRNELESMDRVIDSWTARGWVCVPRDRVERAVTEHGEQMRIFLGFGDGDTVRGDVDVKEVLDFESCE